MLLEALVYALSLPPTPSAFRPHLTDAVGLWSRGRRQRRAWQPHLAAAHAAIEAAMPAGRRGTVAVLGSGPLFDLPLATLAGSFRQVLLLDRAHLIGAQMAARRHRNVEFAWRDLSVAAGDSPLGFLAEVADLDWVISLNLLSQLAHGVPEGAERAVIDAHLAGLAAQPCPATLLTDLSCDILDRGGRVMEHVDLLYDRPMPAALQHWSWPVAPYGEESAATQRVHCVAAYPDWRRAR